MVLCIIIIISYIKHQNNKLANFFQDKTLLFYHYNNVSSADFSRNCYYFVLKTNITLSFPTNNNNVTSTSILCMLFTVSVGLMLMTP